MKAKIVILAIFGNADAYGRNVRNPGCQMVQPNIEPCFSMITAGDRLRCLIDAKRDAAKTNRMWQTIACQKPRAQEIRRNFWKH